MAGLAVRFALPSSAFFILKNLVYEPSKNKSYLLMGMWGLSFVGLVGLRFWISRQFYEGVPLPLWASILILLGIAVGIWYYRKKSPIVSVFVPAYLLTVLSGFSQLLASQFGYGPQDWTGWLPLLFMVLAFFSTLAGTFFLLKKENMT
ncbi:hypothetical protein [Streptococcus suis]|uniref:hypothetical protein n=1 Tax=Streptococcus suis TaxID=1307 RepID=UPI001E468388|nr:hypothetical protein [Streptococcus suis]